MIGDTLSALGLTTGSAARLLGVADRNMRRWRGDAKDVPADLTEMLSILQNQPGALDALRDDYHPDHPDAGPRDTSEMTRRLRWLRARYPG